VLQLETETDMFGLGFYPARQPDTAHLRTWEMAGSAHVDQTTLDYGIASGHVWSPGETAPDFKALCGTVNDGPESIIEQQTLVELAGWVEVGAAPQHGPDFVVSRGAIARDVHGNALGGIRTPAVDAPISTLTGEPQPGTSIICSLFGQTTPFTPAVLAELYPTHASYVDKVQASATAAVRAGFLLPASALSLVAEARHAAVPR
jgi:nucleoid-associated protein YgaU